MKLNKNDRYFNAGVLLIDLQRWRKLFSWSKIKQIINTSNIEFYFHDQCILNYLLKNRVCYFNFNKYNCRPFYYLQSWIGKRIIDKTHIIHYGAKPWEDDFYGLGGEIFIKYARMFTKTDININSKYIKIQNTNYLKNIKMLAAWIIYWFHRLTVYLVL